MRLDLAPYLQEQSRWPRCGRHILAQFEPGSVIVYQAYRPELGHFAAEHGVFGGDFSLGRMSWIKPNFLWMMFRSGWGTKPGQEVSLAVHLQQAAFDEILRAAVPSSFQPELYASPLEWRQAVASSDVRVQWDPDHHPSGAKLERRAIQLGLRGQTLERYATQWITAIEDISDFVAQQRAHVLERRYERLMVPRHDVYPILDVDLARRLTLSLEGEDQTPGRN